MRLLGGKDILKTILFCAQEMSLKKVSRTKKSTQKRVSSKSLNVWSQYHVAGVLAAFVIAGLALWGYFGHFTQGSKAAEPARIIFVSDKGNDESGDGTQTNPVRSIRRALAFGMPHECHQ